MNHSEEDANSRFKLAQLWHFVHEKYGESEKTCLKNQIFNEILRDDFDINYKVTFSIESWNSTIHFKEYTALHFVYSDVHCIDMFDTLLEKGADFTVKNGNGQTVIHVIMTDRNYRGQITLEDDIPFINSVLSAHVKFRNFTNPHNENGFSHLHGACIANHVESLELFLENGASANETVNLNSPKYAGYTPMHFAVLLRSFEVVKILINCGVNINVQTAKRMSPLDLLIVEKYNWCSSKMNTPEEEKLAKLLLDKDAISAVGLSRLHVACTLSDLTIAKKFLDQGDDIDYSIPEKSLIYPGYTALHFAAENSIEAVKMLMKRGAKLDVGDIKEKTPLDICVYKYSLQDICNILSCIDNLKGILLSDGETKLLDLLLSMENSDTFEEFLQNQMKDITAVVPNNSTLFPGYTLLHLVVTFSKNFMRYEKFIMEQTTKILQKCLHPSLSVNVKNARGRTAIHLAFIQGKENIVKMLFKWLDLQNDLNDVVDEDNLSYLHIACSTKKALIVEKLLKNIDPNIVYKGKKVLVPGSTPLHIAVDKDSAVIADMLLEHGANLHAADYNGFMPFHWLLLNHFSIYRGDDTAVVLFNSMLNNVEDHVIEGLELSYLHVACAVGNEKIVEKLLEHGSNIIAIIKNGEILDDHSYKRNQRSFELHSCSTPLEIAMHKNSEKVIKLLLCRGADIVFNESKIFTKRNVVDCFIQVLWDQQDLQRCMKERFGLTKLHIACYRKNEEAIDIALRNEINVNDIIHADSKIFAGCTPLHLLLTVYDNRATYIIESMVKLLLDHGADVTIANAEKDTPIHVFNKHQKKFLDAEQNKTLLLNAQQNFELNPVNDEGVSHFHLACSWQNAEIVEIYLQHGSIDVNQSIDCFAKHNAGCTPLHLILSSSGTADGDWTNLLQIVNLLLEYGASVAVKDVNGDTPLHKSAVFCSPGMNLLEKLLSYGGDIKSKNVLGQSPIEVCPGFLKGNTSDKVRIFEKYGYSLNSWNNLNGEGFIARVFLLNHENLSKCPEFEKFIKSSDVRNIDMLGRTALHNSVAQSDNHTENQAQKTENYIYAIESFVKLGIDVDHQDNSGKTALHYATLMRNLSAVKGLLACGADVNIFDNKGKSPYSNVFEYPNNKQDKRFKSVAILIDQPLRLHINKLLNLRLEVCELNQRLAEEVGKCFPGPDYNPYTGEVTTYEPSEEFFNQIEITKILKINADSLTLFDFLSETKAVNLYPFLFKTERELINEYFKSIDFEKLKELKNIIKLQFCKIRKRLEMIQPALNSLRTLLGFSVPGLREQISCFLSNTDLKNLIKSTETKKRKR